MNFCRFYHLSLGMLCLTKTFSILVHSHDLINVIPPIERNNIILSKVYRYYRYFWPTLWQSARKLIFNTFNITLGQSEVYPFVYTTSAITASHLFLHSNRKKSKSKVRYHMPGIMLLCCSKVIFGYYLIEFSVADFIFQGP